MENVRAVDRLFNASSLAEMVMVCGVSSTIAFRGSGRRLVKYSSSLSVWSLAESFILTLSKLWRLMQEMRRLPPESASASLPVPACCWRCPIDVFRGSTISISLEMTCRMSSTKAEHAGSFCRVLISYITVLTMPQPISHI